MKKLITEQDVLELLKTGSHTLVIEKDSIFTPSAKDLIKKSGISLVSPQEISSDEAGSGFNNHGRILRCLIGSDHTGYALKKNIITFLKDKGYDVIDAGTFSEESCDYPDFALKVARGVSNREAGFGVLLDATGIPSAIAANKIAGIRAATCYNEFTAKSSRQHNNANIIVLGAKALGEETIKSILSVWLKTTYDGGRHQKRLDKISAAES
jgi:ribose 5-phosphate isomerase B